ncbi:YhfX family PLP-dependent enzyme [Jinshanibacter sp. LJY008]|uniref:YhfX family PLP-dependent enzyme n=1 Tax=Limnobaculum eriocheiris TaxID=2897391 RepID=A0A9X1SM18_9GAMM|nr:YhfX family PLP-dependent enzyme [Limnobaculum eriocheiris]MCD1127430.1 YhfX family PLP-dependent enzyme [Limnobaculum eriocheiris]
MFVDALKKQNPQLIEAAVALWRQGTILPDTYVIDVDQVLDNGRKLLKTAHDYGIELYLMTKQIGRNPTLAQRLIELGYRGVVAVDFREAEVLSEHQIPLCHVGHLVQTPDALVEKTLRLRPEVMTVFSLEKARQISKVAQSIGVIQPVMIKVIADSDQLYPGQEAGFILDDLENIVQQIQMMPGIKLTGLTHFPCLLWNDQQQKTLPTPNLQTLLATYNRLTDMGVGIKQLNAPSATSCSTLPLLAEYGVTHTEPGHALTGTIPANQHGTEPERIAMVYITEVSHQFSGLSYCFGGGYYRRGHASKGLVFSSSVSSSNVQIAPVLPLDDSSIDYHIPLKGHYPVGSGVVMCFRTQIFVTRSDVALVSGIQTGRPVLDGIYTSQGMLKQEAFYG